MRSFSVIYFVVLFIFEIITSYYSLYVYCLECTARNPIVKGRVLYITLNIVKFAMNLVLVIISFMHASQLRAILQADKMQETRNQSQSIS